MRNIKEKDGGNFRIGTKVLSRCVGAGVNADLGDPLSELVWSAHSGLSLKRANPGADLRKPFLLWNVGPAPAPAPAPAPFQQQQRMITVLDHGTLVSHSETTRDNCMLHREAEAEAEADPLTSVPTHHQSRKEIVAEASPAVIPLQELESSAENECSLGLGGAEFPREKEGSCMGSQICLYPDKIKGKGKALSDGDIHGRSSDDEDDSAESSHSAGHDSMKGKGKGKGVKKRKIWEEGDILGSKRMKKQQIHGAQFVSDSSFMKWIANMTTTKDLGSLSPLPLACATATAEADVDVDVDAYHKENFTCFRPRGPAPAPAPAPISMGFRAMFQSLYCQETDEYSSEGGRKKIVEESVEVSRQVEVHEENSTINVAKSDGALGEETKINVASPGRSSKPPRPRTSLWITRLATNTLRSEKGKEMSSDLEKAVLPEAMASVFARRLDALRHITASKKGIGKCLFYDVSGCPIVTKPEVEDLKLKLSAFRVDEESCCEHYGSWDDMQNLSEMLAAIRNLRLTRADILRWMNSDVPLSHLNGFFVRLRLGNHEAGVGAGAGAMVGGYYVGCINEAAENKGCTSRKCISVDIGGIKSSIATRYVSNHDFQEDEIKAWWIRIIRSGCTLPSLAHLNSIFNHRQTFRF